MTRVRRAPGYRFTRWANLLVVACLTAAALRGPWGQSSFDTKFDLTSDPGAFLGRALHLWNPDGSLGELQNQAYGYLFPQGLFAWLGAVVGLPAWVTQRLWSALLLVTAYEGTRRLFLALAALRAGEPEPEPET